MLATPLLGTKQLSWAKQWHDHFSFMRGTRPDFALNLYQISTYRNADGKLTTKIEPYAQDYN